MGNLEVGTMIVIRIATTPSLNASIRFLLMSDASLGPGTTDDTIPTAGGARGVAAPLQ